MSGSAYKSVTAARPLLRTSFSKFAIAGVTAVLLATAPAQADQTTTTLTPSGPATCDGVGTIWFSELLAPETDRLTEFYAKVMGWTTRIVDAEDQRQPPTSAEDRYTIFLNDDEDVAGLMRANHPVAIHSGTGWFTYIQVADVHATSAMAQANGGTILRAPLETPEGHWIALISDPMGNKFGLVTPNKKDC